MADAIVETFNLCDHTSLQMLIFHPGKTQRIP